jgi:ferredoxin
VKHNILVKDKNRNRSCCEEKHLMDSLSVCTDLVPRGCHNGACGVCKIKVHSGEFEKLKMNRKHITQEEEMNNIVLACRSFPRGDMEIEFIGKPKSKIYTLGS